MNRRWAFALAFVAIAAACSGDYNRYGSSTAPAPTTSTTRGAASPTTTTTTTTTRPNPTAPTTQPLSPTTTIAGSPAGLPGRIAIIALDGSLVTTKPDGSDERALTIGSPGTGVDRPTWAPDATRLTWTSLGTNSVRVRSATVDGAEPRDALLSPMATAYLWNRTGTDLVILRSLSNTTTELARLDPATLTISPLVSGPAITAAWSPDSTRLAAHVAGTEITIRDAGGTATRLNVTPGAFGTPQWLDDKTVVVAVRDGQAQYLSLVDITSSVRRDLVSFTGSIRFQLDPTGARIAYQVVPDQAGGASNVSLRPQSSAPTTTAAVAQATSNQLAVVDLASRAVTTVSPARVSAFVWSPNGARLAFLAPDTTGGSRWRFWNAQQTIDGATFVPPQSFLRNYAASFDQVAQSTRWWSPDSAAFVYAGRSGNRDGVWIQQMNGSAPTRVREGDTASWSPQ